MFKIVPYCKLFFLCNALVLQVLQIIQSLRAFRRARALGSGRGDLEELDWVPKGRGLGGQGGLTGLRCAHLGDGRALGGSTGAQGLHFGTFLGAKIDQRSIQKSI